MAFTDPAGRRRALPAGTFAWIAVVLALAGGCAARPPRLVPPAGGVEAVEGFGSASLAGPEATVKGKFGFVFRRPGLGRIEAVDPIGRTAFLIYVRNGRAWFVLPGRKVYAEDDARIMMERVLGLALSPDEAIRLLTGAWSGEDADGDDGWRVERDERGRAVRGASGPYGFAVRTWFPGETVPREIAISGPGASGRIKVLKLGFDPPARAEVFDTAFLRAFAPKTWEEILELLDR
jgi:outer membrane biogenesis lipoprotein LolB